MKVIKADLPSNIKDNEVHIYPLSDVHIEDSTNNYKALLKWREEVLSEPNNYVFLNGDILNMNTKNSISGCYGIALTPDEAMTKAIEFLKPLADENRILSVVSGNHDDRLFKESGVDATMRICRELHIEHLYDHDAVCLFISFGKSRGRDCRRQVVSLYHLHGFSSGRKVGSKLNGLDELSGIIDTDIYSVGHTHLPATYRKGFIRLNLRNKKLMMSDKVFVNSNAWLDYGSGYGTMKGYQPSSLSHPKITINGFDKDIKVRL